MVKNNGRKEAKKRKTEVSGLQKVSSERKNLQLRETCRKEEAKEERLLGMES
jgi:hypothetical protein